MHIQFPFHSFSLHLSHFKQESSTKGLKTSIEPFCAESPIFTFESGPGFPSLLNEWRVKTWGASTDQMHRRADSDAGRSETLQLFCMAVWINRAKLVIQDCTVPSQQIGMLLLHLLINISLWLGSVPNQFRATCCWQHASPGASSLLRMIRKCHLVSTEGWWAHKLLQSECTVSWN